MSWSLDRIHLVAEGNWLLVVWVPVVFYQLRLPNKMASELFIRHGHSNVKHYIIMVNCGTIRILEVSGRKVSLRRRLTFDSFSCYTRHTNDYSLKTRKKEEL